MRTFERTHPWLTFRLDLGAFAPGLWMKLGEAKSKCEHIAGVPLGPDTSRELHKVYLAKGVLATTAIEGNTLSEQQVRALLDGSLQLPPSKKYLEVEVRNIIDACDGVVEYVFNDEHATVTPERIQDFNRQVLAGLTLEDGVIPGQIRQYFVGVARYRGAPPEDCQFLLQRLCQWLADPDFDPYPDARIEMAIVRAILAHLYLAWIHPFGDGNGRTARLVELLILLKAGVPTPAAHLLSSYYNETRAEYYRQLERASASGGDVAPFLSYAVSGFVDGLAAQLAVIRKQQWDVTWRNYVHELFKGKTSVAWERRRHLALDLSAKGESVPVADLTKISPRVAEAYARKTRKTLSRDLGILKEMDLVVEEDGKVRAPKEKILAFLPARRDALFGIDQSMAASDGDSR